LNNSPGKKKNVEEFGRLIDMKNKNLVEEKLRKYSLISTDSTTSKSNQRSQNLTPVKIKKINKNLLDFKNIDIPQSNLFYSDNFKFNECKSLEEEYKNNNLNLLENEKEILFGMKTPELRTNENKSGIISTTDYFASGDNSSEKWKKTHSIFKKYNSKIKTRLNFNSIRQPSEIEKDQNFNYFDNFNTNENNTESIFSDNCKKLISPIITRITTTNKGDNLFNTFKLNNNANNANDIINKKFDNNRDNSLFEKIEKSDKKFSLNSDNKYKENNDFNFHLKDKVNIDDEIKNSFFENIHEKLKLLREDNKISEDLKFSKKYPQLNNNLTNKKDLETSNGCKEFLNTSTSVLSSKGKSK
jgi:hypothetical protein